MPVFFEGTRILPNWDKLSNYALTEPAGRFYPLGEILSLSLPFLSLAGLAALIATISFYASSLSRNTMQALAPALLGIIITWFLWVGASEVEEVFHFPLWRGWLVYFIGVPVMALAFVGLMYWNSNAVGRLECLAKQCVRLPLSTRHCHDTHNGNLSSCVGKVSLARTTARCGAPEIRNADHAAQRRLLSHRSIR